jgi:hypothetical protein
VDPTRLQRVLDLMTEYGGLKASLNAADLVVAMPGE